MNYSATTNIGNYHCHKTNLVGLEHIDNSAYSSGGRCKGQSVEFRLQKSPCDKIILRALFGSLKFWQITSLSKVTSYDNMQCRIQQYPKFAGRRMQA